MSIHSKISWQLHSKHEGEDMVALMYDGVYLGIGVQKEVIINCTRDDDNNVTYGEIDNYFFSDLETGEFRTEIELMKSIINNRSKYIELVQNLSFV